MTDIETMSANTVAVTLATENGTLQATGVPDEIPDEIIASATDAAESMTFEQFGVAEPICAALEAAGITRAFPIQALTLPIALGEHDVIGRVRA